MSPYRDGKLWDKPVIQAQLAVWPLSPDSVTREVAVRSTANVSYDRRGQARLNRHLARLTFGHVVREWLLVNAPRIHAQALFAIHPASSSIQMTLRHASAV